MTKYVSGQDPWGHLGDGWWRTIHTEPDRSGNQSVAHDGIDRDMAEDMREHRKIKAEIERAQQTNPLAPGLANDLFWSFDKRVPRFFRPDELDYGGLKTGAVLKRVMARFMETPEYQDLHARTQGNEDLSTIAVAGMLKRVYDSFDEATKQQLERQARLERMRAAIQQRIQELSDLLNDPNTPQELKDQIIEQMKQGYGEIDGLEEQLEGESEISDEQIDQIMAGMAAGAGKAGQQVGETLAGWSAFGTGQGTQPGDPAGKGLSSAEKQLIAERLAANDKFKRLAEIAGRMKEVAIAQQRRITDELMEEIKGTTLGGVAEILYQIPVEEAMMADPQLRAIWALNAVAESLLVDDREGEEWVGRGPLIVTVDNSGSMSGQPELWSKAALLALLMIARRQRRDFAVIHYDTRVSRSDLFPYGEADPGSLMDTLEHFTGGGTQFEPWMSESLKYLRGAKDGDRWRRADVIAITDGLAAVQESAMVEWEEAKRELGFTTYCILIGEAQGYYEEYIKRIADQFLQIKAADLGKTDQPILQQIFSV